MHDDCPVSRSRYHEITLLESVDDTLRAILKDIEEARQRIWIETYIFRDDTLGSRVGESLLRAVERGVDVCLLFDDLGSQETDRAFFERLSAEGVHVRPYRPLRRGLSGQVFPRDHSRIVCVDDVAYTGGFAFGDEWLSTADGGRGFHDVGCRVRGPVLEDFERVFEVRWREALDDRRAVELASRSWPDVALIADSPCGHKAVFQAYRERIAEARRRVWIQNAYFLPPRALLRDLTRAAKRGVDVRVIVPADSDLKPIERAAKSEYANWLMRGIRLFEFTPCVCHGKYAVIDDDWSTVGTLNLNVTSLWWSNEANLFVYEPEFAASVARLFERDQARARPVTSSDLKRVSITDRVRNLCYSTLLRTLEDLSDKPAPRVRDTQPALSALAR